MKLQAVHTKAIDDARRYSQAMIIAQRMVLDGFTEATAHKVLAGRNPLELNILLEVRNIERGQFLDGQDPERLKELARALFTSRGQV